MVAHTIDTSEASPDPLTPSLYVAFYVPHTHVPIRIFDT